MAKVCPRTLGGGRPVDVRQEPVFSGMGTQLNSGQYRA